MSLSSIQLDAFLALSRSQSFSKAAHTLHITQSALSQRIKNLEDDLGLTLFLRDPAGVQLTESGHRLLRYCQMKETLEDELVSQLRQTGEALAGVLRVGGFSSVVRSLVMPALAPLFLAHPGLRIECFSREMRELPRLLRQGQIDFAILDEPIEVAGVDHHLLGYEENVLIESVAHTGREHIHLDHDSDDVTTQRFLRRQGAGETAIDRSFFDDIYGVIDGVSLGFGRAVVPRHLLCSISGLSLQVREIPGFEAVKSPVYLNYFAQPYYTAIHLKARNALLGLFSGPFPAVPPIPHSDRPVRPTWRDS
jgi:DNA-binding transcriptional LysR family regulator